MVPPVAKKDEYDIITIQVFNGADYAARARSAIL